MTERKINFVDLPARHMRYAEDFHRVLDDRLQTGSYILGEGVEAFERQLAEYVGVEHVVAVGNGTDALMLAMKSQGIGEGDEVITSPMSYLATTSSIALIGAEAVMVDIDESLNLDPGRIEEAITDRTKAIMLVHLSGLPAQVEEIRRIADQHELKLIEDCAQSLGACYGGVKVGCFGDLAAVSFHPLKNLGGLGDGGAVFTNNAELASQLRMMRNHGHSGRDQCDFWSVNSRLDSLQAGFLSVQLRDYEEALSHRRRLAEIYRCRLTGVIDFPCIWSEAIASYNWLMILVEDRQRLMEFLQSRGVETKIHYPLLISDMAAAEKSCRINGDIGMARERVDQILSLPNAEHVNDTDVHFICDCIIDFFEAGASA